MKKLIEKITSSIKANYHLYVDAYERTSETRYTQEQEKPVEYKRGSSKVIPFVQREGSNRKNQRNIKANK
ncbi:hypothetical protein [Ferdinandcohnia sp. Marseille-Q9671]